MKQETAIERKLIRVEINDEVRWNINSCLCALCRSLLQDTFQVSKMETDIFIDVFLCLEQSSLISCKLEDARKYSCYKYYILLSVLQIISALHTVRDERTL